GRGKEAEHDLRLGRRPVDDQAIERRGWGAQRGIPRLPVPRRAREEPRDFVRHLTGGHLSADRDDDAARAIVPIVVTRESLPVESLDRGGPPEGGGAVRVAPEEAAHHRVVGERKRLVEAVLDPAGDHSTLIVDLSQRLPTLTSTETATAGAAGFSWARTTRPLSRRWRIHVASAGAAMEAASRAPARIMARATRFTIQVAWAREPTGHRRLRDNVE